MTSKLKVACPQCKKSVPWVASEQYRPFCSERCQQIDLGAWANEEYTIPVVDQEEQWSGTQGARDSSDHSETPNFIQSTLQ